MQNLKSQNGRSMVEMLGVLAIIGVLSVGGVYGYGVAMKKHKANELLHQASMLAADISAQIMTGKALSNITNFGNTSNGTFLETVGTPNDEQFTLQITDVDESVCQQLQSMNGGMVRQVECGTVDGNGKTTATLKFNNNLTSEPVAGDNDGNQEKCEDGGNKYCEGSGSCVGADRDCCAKYDSQCCDAETGDISSTESCTTSDGKDGICNDGDCMIKPKLQPGNPECSVSGYYGLLKSWVTYERKSWCTDEILQELEFPSECYESGWQSEEGCYRSEEEARKACENVREICSEYNEEEFLNFRWEYSFGVPSEEAAEEIGLKWQCKCVDI